MTRSEEALAIMCPTLFLRLLKKAASIGHATAIASIGHAMAGAVEDDDDVEVTLAEIKTPSFILSFKVHRYKQTYPVLRSSKHVRSNQDDGP